MEKMNFVKNGSVIKLPPGFRFHPTDQELVLQYLKRKAFSYPLPASIIPEIDIAKFDPWDLPGDSEQAERYFFSTREAKYRNGNRSNRATGSGYWKATGVDKQIVAPRSNQLVGMKKTLVFYRGKPPTGTRTDWVMHEYRLAGAGAAAATNPCSIFPPQRNNSAQNSVVQMEDWVLCRIFLKKSNSKNITNEGTIVAKASRNRNTVDKLGGVSKQPSFIDFMKVEKTDVKPFISSSSSSSTSSSSLSASSIITDVASSTVSDHDENSSCNSLSSSSCKGKP